MQVSKEGIEGLKVRSPIAEVVAERGIELRRKGRQLVALCPWHTEKTPSFTVSPAKGLFHCFGCGKAGDVIGFVVHHDKVGFPEAVRTLARRAGLDVARLMEDHPRVLRHTPLAALTPPANGKPAVASKPTAGGSPRDGAAPVPQAGSPFVPPAVVEHYHRSFCERGDAQEYLRKRGLTDADLLRALKVGYADGSLLKMLPKAGELRDQLVRLGVITSEGRELLGGCIVVPIPDPVTGQWVNLYGRGLRTPRHCYLPGALRGVLNFQAARCSSECILTESVIDALSFLQAGISTAIPLYGTNGFTSEHLDTLKREGVRRVTLALDNDAPGRRATDALKERLAVAGIAVRVASLPAGIKDANELLVSANGNATELFAKCLSEAEPKDEPLPGTASPASAPAAFVARAEALAGSAEPAREPGVVSLERSGRVYHVRVVSAVLGRLRATVKALRGPAFHVDTLDLYSSRSRSEFARRASKALGADIEAVESDLLAVLVEAEKTAPSEETPVEVSSAPVVTEGERVEAIAFLKRADLLDQVGRDIDTLGYVGEQTLMRLLYLVGISRKLDDPCSAIVLSQRGRARAAPPR